MTNSEFFEVGYPRGKLMPAGDLRLPWYFGPLPASPRFWTKGTVFPAAKFVKDRRVVSKVGPQGLDLRSDFVIASTAQGAAKTRARIAEWELDLPEGSMQATYIEARKIS